MKKYLVIVLCLACAAGCRRLNPFAEQQLVAQVGDERLYVSDVANIFTVPMASEDSLRMLEQYVDAWVMRQLKMQQADRIFPDSEPEIERKVEDFRASLLTFKLDQYHVDAKIDTAVTDDEVTEYYNSHRGDFILDRTLVKGVIVKLPANHPRMRQVRGLMTAEGEGYQDFLDLSRKNNFTVNEIADWMDFSEFLRMLPTNNLHDYDDMLTAGGVQEMRDGNDLYLVSIRSVIMRGDTTPVEMVREDIRRVIINQRRQEIIRAYQEELRRTALEEKELKINLRMPEADTTGQPENEPKVTL